MCEQGVDELCPIPYGNVTIQGVHTVPPIYTETITTIAYKVPDLEGTVTIELYNATNPDINIGCFSSSISNGVTTQIEAVKFLSLGLAAAALVISAVSSAVASATSSATAKSAAGAAAHTAGATDQSAPPSGPGTNVAAPGFHPPGFIEFFSVMQTIAVSGMYSVDYPDVYRKFTQNVSWSAGIITWEGMQNSIDNFRERTGGNLTQSSVETLKETTLIYGNRTNLGSSELSEVSSPLVDKSLVSHDTMARILHKFIRATTATVTTATEDNSQYANGDDPLAPGEYNITSPGQSEKKYVTVVTGIKAYVETLTIPSTNTFMTLLIWWAILAAACIAGILSFKLFLEIWCWSSKKSRFEGFRERYWLFLGSTLVRIITILYGVWVLYCLYQFKLGDDSWGAQLLAGLTLGLFTLVLLGYAARICFLAHKAQKEKNGLEYLFEHKPWLRKYGLFYDQFKIKYWWAFIPMFLASFGRNAFLALGNGNGLVQVIGQLVIDILLCAFFAITMPFNTKMANGINLAIQVVRCISLIFLLIFTVQLNVRRIAVAGVGMALIVIQSLLSVLLAVLILANACLGIFNMTCGGKKKKKKEEEEKKRKEEEAAAAAAAVEAAQHDDLENSHSTRNLLDEKQRIPGDISYSSFSSTEPSSSSTSPTTPTQQQQGLVSYNNRDDIVAHSYTNSDNNGSIVAPIADKRPAFIPVQIINDDSETYNQQNQLPHDMSDISVGAVFPPDTHVESQTHLTNEYPNGSKTSVQQGSVNPRTIKASIMGTPDVVLPMRAHIDDGTPTIKTPRDIMEENGSIDTDSKASTEISRSNLSLSQNFRNSTQLNSNSYLGLDDLYDQHSSNNDTTVLAPEVNPDNRMSSATTSSKISEQDLTRTSVLLPPPPPPPPPAIPTFNEHIFSQTQPLQQPQPQQPQDQSKNIIINSSTESVGNEYSTEPTGNNDLDQYFDIITPKDNNNNFLRSNTTTPGIDPQTTQPQPTQSQPTTPYTPTSKGRSRASSRATNSNLNDGFDFTP